MGLSFLLWLSYTCRGKVCSLVVGMETPRSISELQCEVDGIGALPLGEEPPSIPPLERSTGACALLYCLAPTMGFTKYTAVGTALGPTLTVGMPAHGPGVSQMLFLQGHQHRFNEVRSWDCIEHGAGPTVVLRGSSGSVLARPLK